jgi:uncharacterized membrane protein
MASGTVQYFSKSRVETFSDGVYAIVLTLLVLEIKVPHIENVDSVHELGVALIHMLPKVISWVASFLIVCVIWVNHHRIFEQLQTITHSLFWLNANLLFWSSFIPFPTALMGDYVSNPLALAVFGVILAFSALAFFLMRINILKNTSVLKPDVDVTQFRKATTRSLIFGPGFYVAGAMLSFVHTYIAIVIFLFVPLYFIFFNSTKSSK